MANLADEYGTDVEIYIKALTTTIHADTATGAPGRLLDLLDQLGLQRREVRTAGPSTPGMLRRNTSTLMSKGA